MAYCGEARERSPNLVGTPLLVSNKRVSIKDVAIRAGVSYQTVSKVLNGELKVSPATEARISASVKELGYRPHHSARTLRTQRSQMIGYSWSSSETEQLNHIVHMFLTGVVNEAEAAGHHVLPFPYRNGDDQVAGYRELIDAGRVDGFVLSSVMYDDPRVIYLLERGFPFVAFGRWGSSDVFPYVDVDGAAGLRLATEHLLAQGHRRIGLLAWEAATRVSDDRFAGYRQALEAAGLAVEPELIRRVESAFEAGYTATDCWLGLPAERRPTAVVAMSDIMAIGAMHAAQAHGLAIGRAFGIIGFDDVPLAQYLRPPLTSVRQPVRQAGRLCVDLLVAQLAGLPVAERHVLLQPELVIRGSTQDA
jgi:DNA-binding LacI/PurR family transcriptional regulator